MSTNQRSIFFNVATISHQNLLRKFLCDFNLYQYQQKLGKGYTCPGERKLFNLPENLSPNSAKRLRKVKCIKKVFLAKLFR